jgi:hypothetical protein
MSFRLTSIIGVLTGVVFIGGLVILFILNPLTYEELNNLSLASYNLIGMDAKNWAAFVVYGMAGLMNVLFSIGLLMDKSNTSACLIGKIMLVISGLIWMSFGFLDYDPTTNEGNYLLLIRLAVMITLNSVALILLSVDYYRIRKNDFLKIFSLSGGVLMLFLGFLSVFIYSDATWIRTNILLITYFVWITVFGLYNLLK